LSIGRFAASLLTTSHQPSLHNHRILGSLIIAKELGALLETTRVPQIRPVGITIVAIVVRVVAAGVAGTAGATA